MDKFLTFLLFLLNLYSKVHTYSNLPFRKKYDYIVVGAGSSGATVASRLSERNWSTVLLLEAGGKPLPNTEIPFLASTLIQTSQDWAYVIEPQKYACQGMQEKRCYWPRGKALGGSSSLNFMIYVRGNKRDYDRWAKQGCTGWSYKDVLPFFKKSEDNRIPGIANNGYHGVGGNLTVSYANYKTPLSQVFMEAAKLLNYRAVDYNGASQTGFGGLQATLRDGRRCSTEKAFLRVCRQNFDIVDNAFVTKIQFDKKRARYVVFQKENVTHVVEAKREIIISAGAINTPQLLLLSGVGPKEQLKKLGIPVEVDLQGVGANLQDHVAVKMSFRINQPISLKSERVKTPENFKLFENEGTGPLTVPGGCEGMAFVHTKYSDPKFNYPDVQITMLSSTSSLPLFSEKLVQEFKKIVKKEGLTLIPAIMRPKSRGFLKLRSRDPYVHPIIDPRYLTAKEDFETLMEGFQIVRNLAKMKPYKDLGAEILPCVVPGCENYTPRSKEYWACFVRTMSFSLFHPVGTCKMGNPKNPMTVVDPELKVKGVTGLRIADASVMPNLVSGNTNTACIMIGEKLADMIKRNANARSSVV